MRSRGRENAADSVVHKGYAAVNVRYGLHGYVGWDWLRFDGHQAEKALYGKWKDQPESRNRPQTVGDNLRRCISLSAVTTYYSATTAIPDLISAPTERHAIARVKRDCRRLGGQARNNDIC